ncbi:DUF2344 domain-containing protein [bacterium]|nr:DUF2344 domain-containing protein [bacterium]
MQEEKTYKYRLKVAKNKELRFISHLDWQNLILKIFRRLELRLVLSQGFNKMPKVSYSPALPLFLESDCELVNFQTYEPLAPDFIEEFDKYSPSGVKLIEVKEIDENSAEPKSLENYIQWAQYEAKYDFEKNHVYNLEKIRYIIEKCLSSDEILITKKTKKGIEKTINYRNSLKSFEIKDDGLLSFILKAGQNEEIPSLRADEFLKTIFGESNIFKIKRVKFFDTDLRVI